MVLPPDVIFVIHQIGSGADGGIQSISELIFNTPQLRKLVITNIETPASARWQAHAEVRVWPMREAQHGDEVRGLGYRLGQIWRRLSNNLRLAVLVWQSGTGVVHCNDHRAFWSSIFGAKLAGAKVILNVRDTMRPGAKSHAMWRLALRLCDQFLVLSKEMIASWQETLKPVSTLSSQAAKFGYIYSIVDRMKHYPVTEEMRQALRHSLGIGEDVLAVVCVGRVEEKKGQLKFIERAAWSLLEDNPRIHVYFVGDFSPKMDPYAAACAKAVDVSGLRGRVSFVGYTSASADWYRACDLLVLASEREGLPRCVIEGLACGASIVSFDVCSVREILEGHHCGRVVAQGDYDALQREMGLLISDNFERHRLRQVGPVLAAELFDAKRNGLAFSEYIQKLAEMKKGSGL